MSNSTYSAQALKPVAATAKTGLLRELYEATPLYIFMTAFKSAMAQNAKR